MSNEHKPDYSIVPPTGASPQGSDEQGSEWPSKFVLPQGPSGAFSKGGWTEGNEGFVQQTFLGASVRNFNIAGGFGDSSSNLSVELIEDEYNKSDSTFLGLGDDVYHSGNGDNFVAPPVGTPVFFKFGKNWATVEQAYRRVIDETYGISSIDLEKWEFKDELIESGAFSTTPHEASGEWPNEREKYYLRKQEKTPLYSDIEDPRDDTRTWVDKSFLYEHDNRDRGYQHFTFGGILQSISETRGTNGNPSHNAKVTDPREILSNCAVILKDYAGTTFNNKNLFNVYGFLEYDPSQALQKRLDEKSQYKWIVKKQVSQIGQVRYLGFDKEKGVATEDGLQLNPSATNFDLYKFPQTIQGAGSTGKIFTAEAIDTDVGAASELYPKFFPITGEGFSRRSEQGIPWYRVSHALAALFEQHGKLPEEYLEAGFGGTIDFRGFNYIVDFGGIPLEKIPNTYMLGPSQIDLLSLAQELCQVISHDLFVSLLPVIDPLTSLKENTDEKAAIMNSAFAKNNYWIKKAADYSPTDDKYKQYMSNIIHGVIRVDAIDRSKQPTYGSIQSYINRLENQGIYVENRNLGFELSNVTTDKFVAGAQEVEMYYFSTYKDRDSLEARKSAAGIENKLDFINEKQWTLEASLKQQVLPFYGFLGKKALSIPRGFGSYQQIMLDASSLDAFGVENYYVATEMELRYALKSYNAWVDFLVRYNDAYVEELGELKGFYKTLHKTTSKDIEGLGGTPVGTCSIPSVMSGFTELEPPRVDFDVTEADCVEAGGQFTAINPAELLNREFGVSAPRCVFNSDKNFMKDDNTPASPCSPPYGYPLYYMRAQNIGISRAGAAKVQNSITRVRTQIEKIKEYASSDPQNNSLSIKANRLNEERAMIEELASFTNREAGIQDTLACIDTQMAAIEATKAQLEKDGKNIAEADSLLRSTTALQVNLADLALKGDKNAKKIYEFVKGVATENLGKKFLVKIPRHCNVNYSQDIKLKNHVGIQGVDEDENPIYGDFTDSVREAYRGPFGFKPLPINANGQDLIESQSYIFKMEQIRSDQLKIKSWNYERFLYKDNYEGSSDPLTADKTYQYGALKGNYNPFSEKWNFNYKPEPQGGFLNFALYPRNLSLSQIESRSVPNSKLSPATRYNLVPKDLTNFISDDGRIECYARYDNSQYLDFRGFSADSMTQEVLEGNTFIPDIISELDNVNVDTKEALGDHMKRESGPNKKPTSVAYVKCSVEPRLFMPPKSEETPAMVFGRDISYIPNFEPPVIITGQDVSGCPTYECIRPYSVPIFEPSSRFKDKASNVGYERVLSPQEFIFDNETFTTTTTFGDPSRVIKGGGLDSTIIKHVEYVRRYDKNTDSFIIDTEEENLDSDHVYALITLPGVISTTVNQRYMDAQIFEKNAAVIKNIMTQDVVRGPEGFEVPAQLVNKKVLIDCTDFTFEDLEAAEKAQRDSVQSALRSNRETIDQAAPSPIIPHLVALPLMSTERCYGPWRSAANIAGSKDRYTDIGGKIEFVKNEELAPWNYAGYQLMDEAGKLEAEFSNSLMLFSERGGFVFPSTPSGISIGKALQDGGPLVTSLSINVSEAGVKSTVKMDLYTSRFGKLQKQKEEAIAQIVRERQKIIDTNNEMVRKGLIRSATNSASAVMQNTFAAGNNLENNLDQLGDTSAEDIITLRKESKAAEREVITTRLQTEKIMKHNAQDPFNLLAADAQQQIPFSKAPLPGMPSASPVNPRAASENGRPNSFPSDIA